MVPEPTALYMAERQHPAITATPQSVSRLPVLHGSYRLQEPAEHKNVRSGA